MDARRLARTALLIALTTVATLIIQIPNPATQGYINLGDTMIFVAALVFGGRTGGLAGGLGSALADSLSGYFFWAPWTLVIKGVEGMMTGALAVRLSRGGTRRTRRIREVLALAVGGGWMVLGYFGAGVLLLGVAAALTEVPANLIQAGAGLLIAPPAAAGVRRILAMEGS